jgi:LPS export ABC transporter protein LptC
VRKLRRLLLLGAVFLSLGGVGYKVFETVSEARREFREDPVKALDSLPESTLHVKEFRRSKVENGRKVWEVMGEEADYYKDHREAVIKRPRFLYYNRDGEAAETAGEVARMTLGEKELEKLQIEGGIRVRYQNYLLKSEEAIYLPQQQRIVLPKRTTVIGDGLELEGARMEVELETKVMRMLNGVKTKIEQEKMNKNKGATKAALVSED